MNFETPNLDVHGDGVAETRSSSSATWAQICVVCRKQPEALETLRSRPIMTSD